MSKYYLVDFFCGCGGVSYGFQQAGWDIAMGIDNDPKASESYQANFPNALFINQDIRKITVEQFKTELEKSTHSYAQVKIAFSLCAPCQPFSTNNRNRLQKDDTRLNLLDESIRFIDSIKPDFIFLENVIGMKMDKKQGPFSNFLQYLDRQGYAYNYKTIVASYYGVPQDRKRLILIACKGQQSISYPEYTHQEGKNGPLIRYRTVKDAIGHLPKIQAGYVNKDIPLHQSHSMSVLNIHRIRLTPHDGGSRFDWPPEYVLDCHKRLDKKQKSGGFSNVYGRMWWDKPAPTLTTKCTSISCGRFGHPEQDRAITLLEALLLQSFPEDYKLIGNFEEKSRQIGNAVPPVLAQVFAKHLRNI